MPLAYFCIHPQAVHKRKPSPPLADEPSASDLEGLLLDGIWSRHLEDLPPPWNGYQVKAVQQGRGLLATVFRRSADPVVSFAVSMHSSHGRPLWRTLTALRQGFGDVEQFPPPHRQWCAWIWYGEHFSPGESALLERLVCAASEAWVRRKAEARTARIATGAVSASVLHPLAKR
ncbi:MAG: hypothetical protein PGN26_00080 [Xylophilus ampelinus]